MSLSFDLSRATSDIYYTHHGGLFRADYDHLLKELLKLADSSNLSSYYRDNVVKPFIDYLMSQLQKDPFDRIFSHHLEDLEDDEKKIKLRLPILAEALLQRNFEGAYYQAAFDDLCAFQAIINEISELARKNNISALVAPLVSWDKSSNGPCAITASKISEIIPGLPGVVSLPPHYRNGGLLAWSVMGHEVAGHHFLQSKPDLLEALSQKIKSESERKFRGPNAQLLSEYWSIIPRVDEIASDILGVLSTGPSFALGCIGYFRGMKRNGLIGVKGPFEAQKKKHALRIKKGTTTIELKNLSKKVVFSVAQGVLGKQNDEDTSFEFYKFRSDPHPISILRVFAMIEAINALNLNKTKKDLWKKDINDQIESFELKDLKIVKIIKMNTDHFPPSEETIEISLDEARKSAELVANTIANVRLSELGNNSLKQIFNWCDKDEKLVNEISEKCFLNQLQSLPKKASARHIVAAAVVRSSAKNADIGRNFEAMKKYLAPLARVKKN